MQRKAADLDKHIGLRLKMRRILMNMTQEDLAQKLNITFQQVQKYEKAINRVSASRLYDIAHILNINITYFFEGYSKDNLIKEEVDNMKNYNDSLINKETLKNNDIIASLINMPAGDNKKSIFNFLKEKLTVDA